MYSVDGSIITTIVTVVVVSNLSNSLPHKSWWKRSDHSVVLFLQVRNCSYRVGEWLSQSRSVSEPKLDIPSGFPFKQPRHSDVQSSKQTSMVQSVWEGSIASSGPGIALFT